LITGQRRNSFRPESVIATEPDSALEESIEVNNLWEWPKHTFQACSGQSSYNNPNCLG
jgi:hypothetical protein